MVCDYGIPWTFLLPFFVIVCSSYLFFSCRGKAVPCDRGFSWVTAFITQEKEFRGCMCRVKIQISQQSHCLMWDFSVC